MTRLQPALTGSIALALGMHWAEVRYAAEILWLQVPCGDPQTPPAARLDVSARRIGKDCELLATTSLQTATSAPSAVKFQIALARFATSIGRFCKAIRFLWYRSAESNRCFEDEDFQFENEWRLLRSSRINTLIAALEDKYLRELKALFPDNVRAAFDFGKFVQASILPTMTNCPSQECFDSSEHLRLNVLPEVQRNFDKLSGHYPNLRPLSIDNMRLDPVRRLSGFLASIEYGLARPETLPSCYYLDLLLDAREQRAARRGSQSRRLTPLEWKLLAVLLKAGAELCSNESIDGCWGETAPDVAARYQAIKGVREALKSIGVQIKSDKKRGYRMIESPARQQRTSSDSGGMVPDDLKSSIRSRITRKGCRILRKKK